MADSPDSEVRSLIEKAIYEKHCLEYGIAQPCSSRPHDSEKKLISSDVIEQFAELKHIYDSMNPSSGDYSKQGKNGNPNTCNGYTLPPNDLLEYPQETYKEDEITLGKNKNCIQAVLEKFDIKGQVSKIVVGPRLTRFEISLAPGVNVERITNVQYYIANALSVANIRVLAPIPGKNAVGIEVPNQFFNIADFKSATDSLIWRENNTDIPILLGRDVSGKIRLFDLAKASHLLIAGSIESGVSVCINSVIMSLLFKFSPAELRLIMIDPRLVELSGYRSIPHLITPIINEPEKVPLALRWCLNEMDRRYKNFARVTVKNLSEFNGRAHDSVPVLDEDGNVIPSRLPLLVIIINEFADLMMADNRAEQEKLISQIARKGRVVGIHLIIATQIPRNDVITELIKDYFPTRISLKVDSNRTSHTILDAGGAEKLLGMGDMLFKCPETSGVERIQGTMISDREIQKVVDFISAQSNSDFNSVESEQKDGAEHEESLQQIDHRLIHAIVAKYLKPSDNEIVRHAMEIILEEKRVSTSFLQRRLGIGYNQSAALIDELENRGIVSPPLPGGQKRDILILDELLK